MSEKNYLEGYVEKAESNSNYDYHLAFGMKAEMNFFDEEKLSEHWIKRLEYFEEIDVSQNALLEAVYYYGKWKIEKEYKFVTRSLEKFLEMEMASHKKKWYWVLVECITEQVSLCFKLGRKTDLSSIGDRIVDYLKKGKDTFPTHTIMELTTQFIRLLEFMEKEKIDAIYDILLAFADKEELNYSFREGFYDACVKIKTHYENEASINELHKDILKLRIQEAETKGKHSKIALSSLLERALDYCVTYVKDRKTIEALKKRISRIDYTDELVVLEPPKEIKEKLNEAYRKHDELTRKSVEKYIERIKEGTPIQILYGILNDESIFTMNVEGTKDFTKKLLKTSISNIFTTSLDVGFKRKKLESESEKFEYNLHKNLQSYLIDNLNLVYYITSKLQDEKIITVKDVYAFLSHCEIIDENDIQIIIWGILHHCEGDYLSSGSILTPKIESSLYRYLETIKADVSSYNSKAMSQRSLGGLIELPEVAEKFSIDFQYFMKLLLVADDSINFRNRLSHGATSILEFTRKTSLIVIFLLLKIYAKTFKILK